MLKFRFKYKILSSKARRVVSSLLAFVFLVSSCLITLPSSTVHAYSSTNLCPDTNFANGLRAAWTFGTQFTIDNSLKKGDCTAYRSISPYTITVIPSGDDSNKYWEFEEGIHKDYYEDDLSYDFHSGLDGWVNGNNTNLSASTGILTTSFIGPDPYIYSPQNINITASQDRYLRLRLKNNTADTTLQLFWITTTDTVWNSLKSATVAIGSNMSDYAEYTLDLSTISSWNGTIKQLRIDPVISATSGSVQFEYIRLAKKFVGELYEHRYNVNPVIAENTSSRLFIKKFNNYGLLPGNPNYNTKLIHSFDSNKAGTVKLYHNSLNDVRNVALNHGSYYANDTWPHALLMQNFKQDIDMAQHERINVSFNAKLTKVNQLSTWPAGIPNADNPMAELMVYFFLRQKDNPYIGVFYGLMLYNTTGNYSEVLGVDQHGQGLYRDDSALYGGRLALNTTKTISFDLKKLVAKAIAKSNAEGKTLKLSPDDYTLSAFNIGWEDIGHWETEYELSNFSITGETGITYTKAWEFTSGTEGWDNTPYQCTVGASNGNLNIGISGTDPFTHSAWPLSGINANTRKYLRIKLRNNATTSSDWARVYWFTNMDGSWTQAKSQAIKIDGNSSGPKEYLVYLGNNSTWKDSITQLRIDPIDTGSVSMGSINIDYIRID